MAVHADGLAEQGMEPPIAEDARLVELHRLFGKEGPRTESGAALLLGALGDGLPWDAANEAVATGVSIYYGVPAPVTAEEAPAARAGLTPWRLAFGLGAYVALRPLLGLGHELSVAGLAGLAQAFVESGIWQPLLAWLRLDPVYAGAAIRLLGGVDVQGLSVAGSVGVWLNALVPQVFLDPALVAEGASVSMVAAPGTPLAGRVLAAFGADVMWLAAGLALFLLGRRMGRIGLALFGLLVQAQIGVNHLLDAQVGVGDLEASGLPFAFALFSPDRSAWFTRYLAALPDASRAILVGASLLALAYVLALLPLALANLGRRVARVRVTVGRARLRDAGAPPIGSAATPAIARVPQLAAAALAVAAALSPIGGMAVGESKWGAGSDAVYAAASPLQGPAQGEPSMRDLRVTRGPVPVRLEHEEAGRWRYLVDGRPTVVRGVGYNPQYASLAREDRVRLYARDFAAMRQVGINTVTGWFQGQFDAVTLDAAAANGLGVLLPFDLDRGWDYANPSVRETILQNAEVWVQRYKGHPALRMWAPGNEDLHGIISPTWQSREHEEAARRKADAFAAFLVTLMDRIHALDPDHPVVYRDAEDLYWPRLRAAMERTGIARPWFVYGTNVYTLDRLQQIADAWPTVGLGGPLLVSEFAPAGVGPAERPAAFRDHWACIRGRPGVVIGGLAYTWATNGPEELDRVFGLVGPDGLPTDGSLSALGAAYLSDDLLASRR